MDLSKLRKHLGCLRGRGILRIHDVAQIRITDRTERHFGVRPQTRCHGVKPARCCTWGFKCNVLVASHPFQSTGRICLSVGRGLGWQRPGSMKPIDLAMGRLAGTFLGGRVLVFLTDPISRRRGIAPMRPLQFCAL